MTITRKQIEQMRSGGRICIDSDLEEMILTHYGEEPDGPEYTEQDIHEQIRKVITQYNQKHRDPALVDAPASWAVNRSTVQVSTEHRRTKKI